MPCATSLYCTYVSLAGQNRYGDCKQDYVCLARMLANLIIAQNSRDHAAFLRSHATNIMSPTDHMTGSIYITSLHFKWSVIIHIFPASQTIRMCELAQT